MSTSTSIAIGCDEAAFELKQAIKAWVESLGYPVHDFGSHHGQSVLYPDVALAVAEAIRDGQPARGILLCGTGIGMAITANKVPGIRAAQAHDTYSAERAAKSNDAQIITLGARVVGPELAKMIVTSFLASEFEGGRSLPKIRRISEIERHMTRSNGM